MKTTKNLTYKIFEYTTKSNFDVVDVGNNKAIAENKFDEEIENISKNNLVKIGLMEIDINKQTCTCLQFANGLVNYNVGDVVYYKPDFCEPGELEEPLIIIRINELTETLLVDHPMTTLVFGSTEEVGMEFIEKRE